MFSWLERRVDPFAPFDDTRMPPTTVGGFVADYLRPIRVWLAVLLVVSVAVGIFESGLYVLIGWFVDLLGRARPDTILVDHGVALGSVALAILFRAAFFLLALHEAVVNQVITPPATTMIRWRTHLYTLGHAVSYFQSDFAGRIANRVVQSGPAIRDIATTLLDTMVYVGVFAATALGLFGSVNLWLTLPMIGWIVLYAALVTYFVPRAQACSLANADARSVAVGRVVDSYTNILTLKLFARVGDERSAVRDVLTTWTEANFALMRLITGTSGLLALLNSALLVSTASLSLALWRTGAMTTGEAAAGLALVMRLLAMSGWVMQTVRGVFEEIGTVQESMNTIARPHALVDRPGSRDLVVARGEVRFERVSFHYGRESGIIEGLDLAVRAGEKVGLVGVSGAGKTTITSLLLRLHEPASGRILVDGQDIAGVTQDSLRRQIGVVTQDTSLLHRSIRDNIAYGRAGATEADLRRAAALARADGFIAELEDHKGRRGLDAHVGERGVKLSGGQRQRVAIARVILKDAPILVLDEATSALDSEVEAAIQDALDTLMAGKTVLAIAHRLSTIAALDRLVVLDRGRIVEEGTHAELIGRGGLYARLWHRQSGGFIGREELAVAAE